MKKYKKKLDERINFSISKSLENIFIDLIQLSNQNSESIAEHIGLSLNNAIDAEFDGDPSLKKSISYYIKLFIPKVLK